MNTFNFKSLDIVEGMRIFLGNFLMKGGKLSIKFKNKLTKFKNKFYKIYKI